MALSLRDFCEALDLRFPFHVGVELNSLSPAGETALARDQQGGMWSPKGLTQQAKGRGKGESSRGMW